MSKGHFSVRNTGANKRTVHINGVVGDWYDGNTSQDVIAAIEAITVDEIDVVIQSPGGSAFEGIAIYNALKNHSAFVKTTILGAAASAASIIFMAGDEREMPANTFLMIHEPSLNMSGRARELREAADFLDNLTASLVATYSPYVSVSDDEVLALLEAETWINADDAIEMGFATSITQGHDAVALSKDFAARFDNLPKCLVEHSVADVVSSISNINEFEKTLRESGCSRALANALVAKAKALFQSESDASLDGLLNELKLFEL